MKRIGVISVHTCPLAALGGKETGGMNVYVREVARHLGRLGLEVDVFTRKQTPGVPTVVPLGWGARVVHIDAGPQRPVDHDREREPRDHRQRDADQDELPGSAEGLPGRRVVEQLPVVIEADEVPVRRDAVEVGEAHPQRVSHRERRQQYESGQPGSGEQVEGPMLPPGGRAPPWDVTS